MDFGCLSIQRLGKNFTSTMLVSCHQPPCNCSGFMAEEVKEREGKTVARLTRWWTSLKKFLHRVCKLVQEEVKGKFPSLPFNSPLNWIDHPLTRPRFSSSYSISLAGSNPINLLNRQDIPADHPQDRW
ncbi:hypothetical protein AVEN_190755-1 [Araneus ventricosus]|uniref:Uncharacterized protein n=1 Tax=Araneus ventricosus TaxID=182803 RepID=A0A4Y2HS77_ARAVE|nr:hypothetical protein AVEN_190755-1 [Araneus ventricosus]